VSPSHLNLLETPNDRHVPAKKEPRHNNNNKQHYGFEQINK
jgi:hypothetical protein